MAVYTASPRCLSAGAVASAPLPLGLAVYGLATVLTGAVDVRRYLKAVLARGRTG